MSLDIGAWIDFEDRKIIKVDTVWLQDIHSDDDVLKDVFYDPKTHKLYVLTGDNKRVLLRAKGYDSLMTQARHPERTFNYGPSQPGFPIHETRERLRSARKPGYDISPTEWADVPLVKHEK